MPYKDPAIARERKRQYYLENKERLREAVNAAYRNNPDAAKARSQAWYEANKQRAAERGKQYYERTKGQHAERDKSYRQNHKAERNLANKRYYERHRDDVLNVNKEYKAQHKQQAAEKNAEYYDRNRDRILARNRAWWKANPDFATLYAHRRRAALLNAPGSHTPHDIVAIWEAQDHKCAVPDCPHPISDSGKHKYTVDHIEALANGGGNDKSNLQILCRSHNSRKHTKDAMIWARAHGVTIKPPAGKTGKAARPVQLSLLDF